MLASFLERKMPKGLEGLNDLAGDLRWTGSEASDVLWAWLDPATWDRTRNPYLVLQTASQARLEEAAANEEMRTILEMALAERQSLIEHADWFTTKHPGENLGLVAYFSMEFGLSESLPIYSGGLGVLAGDHLKTAGDLGVPLVGIGLLYQQGYFRQVLSQDGHQMEAFPYNDPVSLPVVPVRNNDGGWMRVPMSLPGRTLILRVWLARAGGVNLYLLDSNDPLNSPWDRAVTASLYPSESERRLNQEIVLGIGGWMMLEQLGLDPQVCHMNEGHPAFVVVARARSFMRKYGVTFAEALWATRPGNVFTTHTPVAAGFDRYDADVMRKYAQHFAAMVGVDADQLLDLARVRHGDPNELVSMACLAARGCGFINGVSRLHGAVSRRIFQPLYPGWPEAEVPVGYVTNGVHVPTWDSEKAHDLWSRVCGCARWFDRGERPASALAGVTDEELWAFRGEARARLVERVRARLVDDMGQRGLSPEMQKRAAHVLDPNALTLGFARRFATYKRPALLLHDPERLKRILLRRDRPIQVIVAGKAHPNDAAGKDLVQMVAQFASDPEVMDRFIFLQDYDMALTQTLVSGVDVWINNPRRPWEASGTSGMKVLVNGGLNLSELDGWWAEAYSPEVGWALGDGREHADPGWDDVEADQLYSLLEGEITDAFYTRDERLLPAAWISKVRQSMCQLTQRFSTYRMMEDYVSQAYLPAAHQYRERCANDAKLARDLRHWRDDVQAGWSMIRIGPVAVTDDGDAHRFTVQVYLGDIPHESVAVQLYADAVPGDDAPTCIDLAVQCVIPGARNGWVYSGEVSAKRPAGHYTPRIVPRHEGANVPLECPLICWP